MTPDDERDAASTPPDGTRSGAAPNGRDRDDEEVRRHESHLVGQIYHLIEANHRLEEQLHRLSRVTEIADLFREEGVTRDTFELAPPKLGVPANAENAWATIDKVLSELDTDTPGLDELRVSLGVVRESGWRVDPDWLADVRARLIAAEQAIAFLNEQSHELDMLRAEKDSIVDGASRLEQNVEDLWKALNEKTTHIQRLESQLTRIWDSVPYRIYKTARKPFRRSKP